MTDVAQAPVLLALADYYGTLAAVRSLGRAGVSVTMAESRWLAPARWSRFVSRTLPCPEAEADPSAFVGWLLEHGAREPGQVLLPTSDDLAWLFAVHREALARHYRLHLADERVLYVLLNKWRLQEACAAVGLNTPRCWLPRSDDDVLRLAREVRYPVLVKPQTQVFLTPHRKGTIVRSAHDLPPLYREFRDATRHDAVVTARDPAVGWPMLQAFVRGSDRGVYSVSGFVDPSSDLFVTLAAEKVLQRPRRTGVGICFEPAAVVPELAGKLAALCRHVGYQGVFEAEFLRSADGYQLIDFNPRFYGQMAFDVDRGLDLPWLSYLGALGEKEALRAAVEAARVAAQRAGARVYCNTVQLLLFLGLLRVTGRMSGEEARGWLAWRSAHRRDATEPALSADDWAPGLADVAAAVYQNVAHIRSALRAARDG